MRKLLNNSVLHRGESEFLRIYEHVLLIDYHEYKAKIYSREVPLDPLAGLTDDHRLNNKTEYKDREAITHALQDMSVEVIIPMLNT